VKKSSKALQNAPARNPSELVRARMGARSTGINAVANPATTKISDKSIRPRSANRPPTKYPTASEISVTEMSDDQTNMLTP
jgi:hypothetical protein